ncbi:hypothetical protein NPIL_568761, partial [Nephila pilipes]
RKHHLAGFSCVAVEESERSPPDLVRLISGRLFSPNPTFSTWAPPRQTHDLSRSAENGSDIKRPVPRAKILTDTPVRKARTDLLQRPDPRSQGGPAPVIQISRARPPSPSLKWRQLVESQSQTTDPRSPGPCRIQN